MRWYKHLTNMLDDAWVQDELMTTGAKECGLRPMEAYGFWCALLELFAAEWDGISDPKVFISEATLMRKCHANLTKVSRFLRFGDVSAKFSCEKVSKGWVIELPRMAELKDEYSSRRIPKNRDTVGSVSGIRNTEYREQKEENKISPPLPPSPEIQPEGEGVKKTHFDQLPSLAASNPFKGLVFFTWQRGNVKGDERQWLTEHMASLTHKAAHAVTLEYLWQCSATVRNKVNWWLEKPIHKRMAAFAAVELNWGGSDKPFDLAFDLTKRARGPTDKQGKLEKVYWDFYAVLEAAVAQGDYHVECGHG